MCLDRWVGKSEAGISKFREDNAVNVYADFFKNEAVVRATCDDYRAGAEEDVELQEEDQKSGRKIGVNVLVIYSKDYLGARYNIRSVWEGWMADGAKEKLDVHAIGGGVGHFIAEEAPDEVANAVLGFYHEHV